MSAADRLAQIQVEMEEELDRPDRDPMDYARTNALGEERRAIMCAIADGVTSPAPTSPRPIGLSASARRDALDRELQAQERAAAATRSARRALPSSYAVARHEAAHAVVAMALGVDLDQVTGRDCIARTRAGDRRDAIWALAGEAADRESPITPIGTVGSDADLAMAARALGTRASSRDWYEAREEARQLVAKWRIGIAAIAKQLEIEGLLTGAQVLRILTLTYFGQPEYLKALGVTDTRALRGLPHRS